MSKKNKTPFAIFGEALKLYFSNFDKFFKYMTFPVIGQVIGSILIFICVYFYTKNIPTLIQKFPNLNNHETLFLTMLLLILPGLLIFIKAFWEYLIAYGAINSMLENMLKSGKVYDFDAHTERIKRRSIPFIGLWILLGGFTSLLIIPLLWVPCGVLAIFFVLSFQVFTFEPELTSLNCIKRSFNLIKGHFASTFLLIALIGALTYSLIPNLVNFIFKYTTISSFLAKGIRSLIELLPITDINSVLSFFYIKPLQTESIAFFIISSIIFQTVIQYTLPIRSLVCGLWYKNLNNGYLGIYSENKTKKKNIKKPSEKLIEASKKKYSTKKLDRNILKRAMEKDDN